MSEKIRTEADLRMSGEQHGKLCQCGAYHLLFGAHWAETLGKKIRHTHDVCAPAVPLEQCEQCKAPVGLHMHECPRVDAAVCWRCRTVLAYNEELEHKHAALKVRLLDAQKRIGELEARVADLECQVLEWRHL